MNSRRKFIRNSFFAGAGVLTSGYWSNEILAANDVLKLTILHTNDTHSRIDPLPLNFPNYGGMGGFAKRAELVNQIRAIEKNVLLLDAGDIFQGTPYFNLFGGELELKLMSKLGYDAATMGNHDFDNGVEGFHKVLPNASFPFICSNYNFENTLLNNSTKPYIVLSKNNIKIGIYGLGIELQGLVLPSLYAETKYNDALTKALEIEKRLKSDEKCDLIICLSHLGFEYDSKKMSDRILAKETYFTDIIIGGHTHSFIEEKVEEKNKQNQAVLISQVGFAGIKLGRIDVYFEPIKKKMKMNRKSEFIN